MREKTTLTESSFPNFTQFLSYYNLASFYYYPTAIVFPLATNDILNAKSYFVLTLLDFSIKFSAVYYFSRGF